MDGLLVGVDAGTGSARAGVLTARGELLGRGEHPIAMRRTGAVQAEQNSEDIWHAACLAVREALQSADAQPDDVVGISFDATCSLVIRDRNGAPLNLTGEAGWDTMAWFDHRAMAEAEEITAAHLAALDALGGVMSPEMQIPKLMWLKRHRPDLWAETGYLFDLADFLTWKATGTPARSQGTLACKWNYAGHSGQTWPDQLFQAIGLSDLLDRGGLPEHASPIGTNLGPLTEDAADQLGLTTRCHVGIGLVDAHAGALGLLGPLVTNPDGVDSHLALIAGTSSCVMAITKTPHPGPGIWGPHWGGCLPKYWVTEAGQSASGGLLDYLIRGHGAGGEPTPERHSAIIARIQQLKEAEGPSLARRLHVLPDFHGNRSPQGDSLALGVISGLDLDSSFDNLCRLYWRSCVSLALQLREILEHLQNAGHRIDILHVTGGHTKNPILMDLYADVLPCRVVESTAADPTLLGVAMVAATAARLYPDLETAASAMRHETRQRKPDPGMREQLERDYRIFKEMVRHRWLIEDMELRQ